MSIIEILPQRLREYRKFEELTLSEVGERINMSISFLSDIETGRAQPSLDTLVKLAECYHTTVAQLCAEFDEQQYEGDMKIHILKAMLRDIESQLYRVEGKSEPKA